MIQNKLSFRASFDTLSFVFRKNFLTHSDEVRSYLDGFVALDVFHTLFQKEQDFRSDASVLVFS